MAWTDFAQSVSKLFNDASLIKYGNKNQNYYLSIAPNNAKSYMDNIVAYLPESVQFSFGSDYGTVLKQITGVIDNNIDSTVAKNDAARNNPIGNPSNLITLASFALKGWKAYNLAQDTYMNFKGAAFSSVEYVKNFISWTGSRRLHMQIPIVLIAFAEPKEAYDNYKKLVKLSLPSIVTSQGNGEEVLTGSSYFSVPGPMMHLDTENVYAWGQTLLKDKKKNIKELIDTTRCLSIHIGQYATLDNMILKSVSGAVKSAFTIEGYPIYIATSIEVESIFPMTTNDIDTIFTLPDSKTEEESLWDTGKKLWNSLMSDDTTNNVNT